MKPGSLTEIFVKVVESGSFSETARHFDLTPSAVSKRISQLEESLGARLFQRTTRSQSLTEAGSIYYSYAQGIVSEQEAARVAIFQLSDKPKGSLSISAERDFAETFIQPLLTEFFTRYPEVNVHLSLNDQIIDVVSGAVDVAIRMGHLSDSSLIARKLMDSHSVVCASPDYFRQHKKPQSALDLRDHNCLSFRTSANQVSWNLSDEQGEFMEIPVSGNFRVNSLAMLKDAALKGAGIIFVPRWYTQQEINQGLLVPLDFKTIGTPIHAVFANNRQLAPKVRVFIDFLTEQLQAS